MQKWIGKKKEIIILVALWIVLIVALFAYEDRITTAEVITILTTAVLVSVTYFYAWRTAEQAKANKEMAEETRKARHAAFRPVLSLLEIGKYDPNRIYVEDNKYITPVPPVPQVKFSRCVVKVRNVGVGPALDVEYLDHEGNKKSESVIEVATTPPENEWRLYVKVEGIEGGEGRGSIIMRYKDIFDNENEFESKREVWFEAGEIKNIGPLQIRELPKRSKPK